jgi:hypothetical protein
MNKGSVKSSINEVGSQGIDLSNGEKEIAFENVTVPDSVNNSRKEAKQGASSFA